MKGCNFSERALTLLKKEVQSGEIVVVSHTKAPKDVQLFPHFTKGSKSYKGMPKSVQDLYTKLGVVKEGFEVTDSCGCQDCAMSPHYPSNCTPNTYGWWKAGVF